MRSLERWQGLSLDHSNAGLVQTMRFEGVIQVKNGSTKVNSFVALGVFALVAAAGTANAGLVLESEPNNTAATANPIGTFNIPGGSVLIDGTITPGTLQQQTGAPGTPGDVDWFTFTVTGISTVVASIFSLNNTTADSQLWLVSGNGTTILAFNDNGNPGGGSPSMSSLIQFNLAPGTYFLAVSGFNDGNASNLPDGFAGNTTQLSGHTQSFDYKFLVGFNVIPTPGATALLGLGALAIARRRR
jgi:hypothetical protein